MDSRKITIEWSSVIPVVIGILAGLALGLIVGTQIDEVPRYISSGLMLAICVLGGVLIPFVRKKEEENKNK